MKTIVDSFILGKSVVLSRSRWKEKQQTCAGRRGLGKSMHVIHVQVCTWNDGSSRFCQWSGINSDPTSYVAVRGGHPKKSLHPTSICLISRKWTRIDRRTWHQSYMNPRHSLLAALVTMNYMCYIFWGIALVEKNILRYIISNGPADTWQNGYFWIKRYCSGLVRSFIVKGSLTWWSPE
jgi:hypothetical protein